MPTTPRQLTLTNSSVDILNAIRNNASTQYQNKVPIATADADIIKSIGAVLMDYPTLLNEFTNALINRIGRVYIQSKLYENPLAVLKKGILEFGESTEEIFIAMAKPYQYDPEFAETNVFKREIPDLKSAFHVINYKKFFKTTVQEQDWKRAFLSIEGVTDVLEKTIEQLYTGANYCEYMATKYLVAKTILNGFCYPVSVSPVTDTDSAQDLIVDVKKIANDFTFMKNKYNISKVKTKCDKSEQVILIDQGADALIDVKVLAVAFNMSVTDLNTRKIVIDGFGDLDDECLADLFEDTDSTYHEFTSAEKEALNSIPMMLMSEDFLMIYDNLIEMRDLENGEGLSRNFWLHNWKTLSISPFANCAIFVPATPTVTGITVTPSTATVAPGSTLPLVVEVATTNFAPETVTYASNNAKVTVNASGVVTIGDDATGTATITVTSVFDSTVTATATLTISEE